MLPRAKESGELPAETCLQLAPPLQEGICQASWDLALRSSEATAFHVACVCFEEAEAAQHEDTQPDVSNAEAAPNADHASTLREEVEAGDKEMTERREAFARLDAALQEARYKFGTT